MNPSDNYVTPEEARATLRQEHGIDPFYELYTFYDLGYNVRPTEINGFLGKTHSTPVAA